MGFIAGYDGNGYKGKINGISPTIWIQYKWEYNGYKGNINGISEPQMG